MLVLPARSSSNRQGGLPPACSNHIFIFQGFLNKVQNDTALTLDSKVHLYFYLYFSQFGWCLSFFFQVSISSTSTPLISFFLSSGLILFPLIFEYRNFALTLGSNSKAKSFMIPYLVILKKSLSPALK